MKALFLIFHGFNEANGISKKIRYQVKALKDCGVDVRLCHYDVTSYGERRWMVDDEVIADFGTGFAAKIWKRVYYSPILDYARREGIDFVYMRSFHNASPFTLRLVKSLKRTGAKVVMEIPTYHKLLFFSDAAVIPRPTLQQRIEMIWYAICTCRHFGIEQPRVALIHCTEKVSAKFPHSLDYVNIVELAEAGEFGNVIIDGPLDVRTACEQASGDIKGIVSPINGQADVLIFPNIESGNAFYKSVSLFAKAEMAGLLQGPICPVVLPSRSDSGLSKYYSIAMACLQVSRDCECRKQASQVTNSSF